MKNVWDVTNTNKKVKFANKILLNFMFFYDLTCFRKVVKFKILCDYEVSARIIQMLSLNYPYLLFFNTLHDV